MAGTPKVIILSEQLRGQSFELTEDQYTIGRTDASDISVPDPTISGHHATLLQLENGGFAVRDEGSTNGTRVNGVRLEAGEVQPLVHSDILQVGGVEMLFDCEHMRTDSSTTQTVINLEDVEAGDVQVSGMSNLGGNTHGTRRGGLRREDQKQTLVIWALIGALALAALIALGFFVVKTVGSSG